MFWSIYNVSWWVRFISNFTFNCSLYVDSVSIVCWIKVSSCIISMLFVAWPPDVEAICAFFGLSPVMLLVWDCFKIRVSFFRFSISFSLGLGSWLVLEVLLDGDFPRLCGCLFGFNVFSLLRSVWNSSSSLALLDLWVILTLVPVLLVPCPTLAYVFWNPVLCLVGCGVSSVVEFGFISNNWTFWTFFVVGDLWCLLHCFWWSFQCSGILLFLLYFLNVFLYLWFYLLF